MLDAYKSHRTDVHDTQPLVPLRVSLPLSNTRLAIRTIADMCEAREPLANVLEDYPYLARQDVEYARVLWRFLRVGAAPTGRVKLH